MRTYCYSIVLAIVCVASATWSFAGQEAAVATVVDIYQDGSRRAGFQPTAEAHSPSGGPSALVVIKPGSAVTLEDGTRLWALKFKGWLEDEKVHVEVFKVFDEDREEYSEFSAEEWEERRLGGYEVGLGDRVSIEEMEQFGLEPMILLGRPNGR